MVNLSGVISVLHLFQLITLTVVATDNNALSQA